MNDELTVMVTIKVVLVAKDGLYSVSEFSPELWEQKRDACMDLARREHAAHRADLPLKPY
jgi:hypothetical protein